MRYYNQEDSEECCTGCNIFFGGEIRHIKECTFYPESLTERYDKIEKEIESLKQLNEKYREVIEFYADPYVFDSELMGDDDDCQIDMDKPWRCYSGKRARQALEIKSE